VLAQMVKTGLPEAEYRALITQPMRVTLTRQTENLGSAPHFAAHARKWLVEWADANDQDLYADGLVIETTLDTRLQKAAEEAVEKQAESLQQVANMEWSQPNLAATSGGLESYAQRRSKVEPFAHFWKQRGDLLAAAVRDTPEFRSAIEGGASEAQAFARLSADAAWMKRLKAQKTRLEAGFVAMDPATGEVKAWVGSRDFNVDQYDHVAQAERQPGSTFKPFVYGAALESGLRPDHGYIDEAVEIRSPDGSVWRPTDMAGASGAMLSLREGLVYSKNSITAQVMQDVGVSRVVSLARAAGVDQSRLDPVPSLALGTSPVTLLEMVNAYATIAQEGQHHQPVFVKRIRDRHGKVIAEFGSKAQRAMSADSAVELIDMMRGVVSQGTGTMVKTRFGIVADIAGKTGTTQNNTDGWFILMHPQLVAGAWVGFNDSRVTMRSNYWGQGGHNAVLLVGDFFRDSLKSGLIDPKARFAAAKQSPQVMANWSSGGIDRDTGASIARLEVDPHAPDEEGAPKNSEELDRVLTNLSHRDSHTSTAVSAESVSPSPRPREMPAQLLRIRSDTGAPLAVD
jgi:penicillin-binding protein 1A